MPKKPPPRSSIRLNHDDRKVIAALQTATGLPDMIDVIRLALREARDARVKT